jgi:hypothetical protein
LGYRLFIGVIETLMHKEMPSIVCPNFNAPFNTATNVMIAQTATETDTIMLSGAVTKR